MVNKDLKPELSDYPYSLSTTPYCLLLVQNWRNSNQQTNIKFLLYANYHARLCEEEQRLIKSCLCQLWNSRVVTSRFWLMDLQWLPPAFYTKSRFISSNQSSLSTLPIICTLFLFSFHLTLQHNCTMGDSVSISASTVSFSICSFYLESLCSSHCI